jgi:DNA-binding beta-propeller fold protein YncE
MEGRGFYYPSDAVIDMDGRLLVANRSLDGDPRGVRVTICNMESEYFGTFATFGEDDGQLVWPTAIAVDSTGRIYVSDEYTHRINVFDSSGGFLAKWGAHGEDAGELDGPSGMAFDQDDNLFVVDHRNNRVQKYTKDGQYLAGFGSEGDGDGQFNLPWGMTIDAKGELYVADWRNDRIQKFSPEGEYLAQYGSSGRGDGQFSRLSGVAVDEDGYMYVADWGNERVQVLDPEGRFVIKLRGQATLSKWAEDFLNTNVEEAEARAKSNLEPDMEFFVDEPHEESAHIEKHFWAPVSIKYAGEGIIYVIESNRHRIQVYERAS